MSNTIRWKKACILGVGLLGGSIAKALRTRRLVGEICGWGRKIENLQEALRLGIVDHVHLDLKTAASDCDLVIAATPVQQIVACLHQASSTANRECLYLDVGSTKCTIAAEAIQHPFAAQFCPSHPIAGSEKSGAEYATEDLFVGKCTVLTPTASTTQQTIDRAQEFWTAIGSNVMVMTPQEHDAALANTSHVPHLVASVMAATTPENLLSLVGSGWSDTTRIASGDPQLWTQIVEENYESILAAMYKFSTKWKQLLEAVERQDYIAVHEMLLAGKVVRDSARSESKS